MNDNTGNKNVIEMPDFRANLRHARDAGEADAVENYLKKYDNELVKQLSAALLKTSIETRTNLAEINRAFQKILAILEKNGRPRKK